MRRSLGISVIVSPSFKVSNYQTNKLKYIYNSLHTNGVSTKEETNNQKTRILMSWLWMTMKSGSRSSRKTYRYNFFILDYHSNFKILSF